ncbi:MULTISPECIES: glycoside hydrolase family 32 protein [Clostridium]|uniref:glycoside hydrolase family 32 protein n=1 Tax=Clostridium TaxID=1485 RepID=UPI00069DE548|nr:MULTISPECIES: glycoside hydrolase family 32 protein [Clostridium]KOF56558.1 hypothetical protein AGR56_07300 [Clostridium sp. DMHC 10]MCD2347119.1 glycoside hydrolase family 32 protein [Clostridium guangxiense]
MNLYRPIYHFMPEKNWMNDPNGVIYYKGEYHLFYQYNPYGSEWGNIHWGHAKSKDLVHWKHLPIALYPSKDKGEIHCFSGCAVINGEKPTIFYTSIGEGERNPEIGAQQWSAVSEDNMLTWRKSEENPIMTSKINGDIEIKHWRDPFVWNENGKWFMVLGGSHNKKGCALIYKSQDLKKWEFLNILCEGEDVLWECPNFFKLGDKYVLIVSPDGQVEYYIGTLNSEYKFIPEFKGILDYGGWEGFYAPNSLVDNAGRRIMIAWMPEHSRGEFDECGDWAGVQCLPRTLEIKDNMLRIKPVKEFEVLRKEHEKYENFVLESTLIPKTKGKALEVIIEAEMEEGMCFSIDVLSSKDEEEKTSIKYEYDTESFYIDRSKSSISDKCHKSIVKGNIKSRKYDTLKLQVFVDYSTVEVFANDEKVISARVYAVREDSENIKVSTLKGKSLKVKSLDIWKMSSILE